MKKRRKLIIGAASILIIIAAGSIIFKMLTKAPTHPIAIIKSQSQIVPAKNLKYDIPKQIKIPKIGINAKVQKVKLTSGGDMDVPTNIVDVGWFEPGTIPGKRGSAVMDGHFDGPNGEDGVFFNLKKLIVGDIIHVIDIKNQTVNFKVKQIKIYDQNDHPTDVFKSSSGNHLNLITCTGPWDSATKHFTKRLIIFTDQTL